MKVRISAADDELGDGQMSRRGSDIDADALENRFWRTFPRPDCFLQLAHA
jgi:hypothetical protein